LAVKRSGVSEFIGPSRRASGAFMFDDLTIDGAILVVRSSPIFLQTGDMRACYELLFTADQRARIAQRPRLRDAWMLTA